MRNTKKEKSRLMAGWSESEDGLGLQNVEIVQTFKSKNKLHFDLDSSVKDGNVDDCDERLRSLFDQVLLVFLREIYGEKCIRPIPALLGDGHPADLFNLFWVVWKIGGYDSVSRNGFWDFVAEECRLDGGLIASVKLVYMMYLNELDQLLRTICRDKRLGSGESDVGEKLGLLLLELQKEFRSLLYDDEQDVKKKDGELVELESRKMGNTMIWISIRKSKINASDKTVVNQVSTSMKRKRESLSFSGMVNWVTEVAKHPDDPAIGRVPECSKWNDYSSDEFWVQALLARNALLTRHVNSNTKESPLQKKQKMHPSMYDDSDVLNHQSGERLRCSERLPSFIKHRSCPCCNSCSASSQNKVATPRKMEVENNPKEQALSSVEIPGTTEIDGILTDVPLQKHVSVGPLFQAEVPKWTGVIFKSNSKWLGTRMWPPENGIHNSIIKMERIGKGRGDSCDCQLPGSVRCVRFHIAENRMKLKCELGLLFYHWRFDRMGEEVSLSWTMTEEKRFKDLVRLKPPSLNKCFWDGAFKFFPTKTKEKLVSYYFNVFLVRREHIRTE
ncbi:AT-rich interactive domain-containing protein 2 [Camellia lanceoleosa]|uniref:AT-rich interactive domain-containing protein 2 n=1 Tax=Camellia lanceoleosa TaxID=1840588 RepID=A0ACC0FL62_9ERIC|nr:AT-rich interactive domain-containing protein 2 [Camellia lanceoleosa]